ncbi:c-type cytochrome [Aliiroseovarius crassostreae]|uniref:c-type cytochrome n=1 Tax=Aliiroseovarius crassostreae TaxID=154981 RepID=UPI003C7A4F06
MKPSYILLAGTGLAGLAAFAFWVGVQGETSAPSDQIAGQAQKSIVPDLVLPELTDTAQIGKKIFDTACASCHGANAAGQDGVAPPLVHKIYEPSHHADEAFQRAAAVGVRAHHWPFGSMPPVEGISRGEVAMITRYIRELQRANGIK